jgi:superfamily II DNA or RNA helicase
LATEHHSVGKETGETAHVERWNNTLRQRLARFVRKTLSFSKSDEFHEIALRRFIHEYNQLTNSRRLPISNSRNTFQATRFTMQQFSLRKHQLDAVQAAINKPHNGVLTAVIPPGGGKTILALAVLDAMRKAGKIDAAVVFTPRLGLCSQFELDWKSVRQHFQPGAMGAIVHRENESIDSLRGFGYITSYQSLCADPAVHLRFARRFKGRLAIVCDEAHYLGEQLYGNGETTQAAKILAQIGEYTAFKLVMTGTPYRSDENPIVFVDYDDEGKIKADVQISYSDGVAQGYLRPFDATLFDGSLSQTRRYQRDGVTRYRKEEIDLSSTAQQLTKVATDPHSGRSPPAMPLKRSRSFRSFRPAIVALPVAPTRNMRARCWTICKVWGRAACWRFRMTARRTAICGSSKVVDATCW